jgi:Leucine-rich repeat (LRR) protein
MARSWLYSNELATVPASMGNLKRLKRLWLDRNQISALPEELGGMSSLQVGSWVAGCS